MDKGINSQVAEMVDRLYQQHKLLEAKLHKVGHHAMAEMQKIRAEECETIRDHIRAIAESPPAQAETGHAGDCTIYAALCNDHPTDGICTCGYGWRLARKGDLSQMYSQEREAAMARDPGGPGKDA